MKFKLVNSINGKGKFLSIIYGAECTSSSVCKHRKKCKYRLRFRLHNIMVEVRNFFRFRLHINLPFLLYIGKDKRDLSGTTMCPHNMPRRYTCYDCEHSIPCTRGCAIPFSERQDTLEDPDWGKWERCILFKKSAIADCWDKNTGEWDFTKMEEDHDGRESYN